MTEPIRIPGVIFRADEAEYPIWRDRPGWADCRCACAFCGDHLTCGNLVGVDDVNLCTCHGVPWNIGGGPCVPS